MGVGSSLSSLSEYVACKWRVSRLSLTAFSRIREPSSGGGRESSRGFEALVCTEAAFPRALTASAASTLLKTRENSKH
ncbi:hypothetical protein E2C01_071319 [Portunus trituberculatus]|uniref:Uncharacterized protein n=1 Tax=Portunus trituberculatus TaxID=210409 RepID=A0A5B7I7X0_PORTR|nr:hypothetical protein [Portunus trituberculatus]